MGKVKIDSLWRVKTPGGLLSCYAPGGLLGGGLWFGVNWGVWGLGWGGGLGARTRHQYLRNIERYFRRVPTSRLVGYGHHDSVRKYS